MIPITRGLRRPVVVLLLLVALTGAACLRTRVAPSAPDARSARVDAVDAIAIVVSDLERAVDFYARVLGFEKIDEMRVTGAEWNSLFMLSDARARVVAMKLGDERIELVAFAVPGRPMPPDARSNDRSFQHIAIIVSDMARAHHRLVEHDVRGVSVAPQRLPDWNPNAGGIVAYYFRDPDGHALEILHFPPDKGHARWHRSDRLFLGIDHTAITVASTERSLHFYRDELGMRIVGESLNYGPEQEALNDVPGARVRITSVAAARGPAVEFLEYLHPLDGRPMPADLRANDVAAWRIVARSAAPAPSILRDPDGHLVHLRPR